MLVLLGYILALKLFPRKVYVLTSKRSSKGAASAWAQGGIAAALSKNDSIELHKNDTIKAGDGLVDPEIAKILASEGPGCVHDLSALGYHLIKIATENYLFLWRQLTQQPELQELKVIQVEQKSSK